jgi:sialate O-acetylesterase
MLVALCLAGKLAFGKVILPELIGDNMVLQQESTALLWGWAEPNEKVTVFTSWNHRTADVRTDSQGVWKVKMATTKAGGPYYIEFTASNHIKVENVLLGEVWLVAGQSNGEVPIEGVKHLNIRIIDVRNTVADIPVMGISGRWKTCSPGTAGKSSPIAYYFAKKLYEEKGIPVGIINCCAGRSPVESWIKKPVLESDANFKPILDNYEKHLAQYPQKHEEHLIKMDAWHRDTSANKGKAPAAPIGPKSSISPYKLYNGMIAPLLNYKIAGVIWCQAEANIKDPDLHQKLFSALIRSWRADFKNDNLPFVF